MKNEILAMLEKDSRTTLEDMATMLNADITKIAAAIDEMTAENIICGYKAMINWDKTDRDFVTALIEVKVAPQREQGFDNTAKRIYMFDEVKAVYLISGDYDLSIIIEGKSMKEISYFVSNKLSPIESVLSTATHFVMKKYKDNGVIFEETERKDERMIVSP